MPGSITPDFMFYAFRLDVFFAFVAFRLLVGLASVRA